MIDIKIGFFKKRVFLSWIFSYAIVLTITIIIFFLVYTQIEGIVVGELSNSNVSLLRQVQQSMDNQISDMQRLSLEIALNKQVEGILEVTGELSQGNEYTIYEIVKDLSIYKTVNGFTDNFFIYLKNSNTVLSPNTSCRQDIFLMVLNKDYGLDRDQWEKMTSVKAPTFMPLYLKNSKQETVKDIVYIQPIPIRRSPEDMGDIVILLNADRFDNVITNISKNSEGKFFILNEDSVTLAETKQSSVVSQSIKYRDLKSDWGIFTKTLAGKNYAISYVTSGITGWKYVSVMDVGSYMKNVSYARRLIVYGVIACFLIGGLISYLFLKRNYNPINAIMQTLEKRLGIKVDNKYNEYRFIQETIQNAFDEINVADGKLKQQGDAMRASFVSRLMTGKISKSHSMDELLKSYEIQFLSNRFAVIVLTVEDYGRLSADLSEADKAKELRQINAILSSIFEELANRRNKGYMTEIDDMQACLVNFNGGEGDAESELLELSLEMQKILEERFNIYLSMSISDIHLSPDGIPEAYREAMEAMEYRIVDDNKKIYNYREISRSNPDCCNIPKMTEQQLISSIKTGNTDEAKDVLDEIFKDYFSNKAVSMKIVKFLTFDLIDSVMKALADISTESRNYFFNELNPLEKIQKCETLKEIKAGITETVCNACEYVKRKKKSHNTELKDKVADFVGSNYADVNLNVKMIADKFEMNPVYISRFAKEQLGDSLLDYINKYRLEKAKQMMRGGNLAATEIAKRVGYCNMSTFIRVFKKYEGMTPGQYKKNSV